MDITIRIAGEAGQGVQTTGSLLASALATLGLHVLATQSYLSRIRGGLNWFDLRVADVELHGATERVDLLVSFTAAGLSALRDTVTMDGLTLMDADSAEGGVVAIPFTNTAREVAQSALMANTVAAGAVFALLGYPLERLHDYLAEQFQHKGEAVIAANRRCAHRGAGLALASGKRLASPAPAGAPSTLTAGADAIALGAATAGVTFVAAYPMSPGTATFAALAGLADEYGMVVEQAEDEIAAINMVIGATYTGAPALTTTSGGGFALMVEGLSLAGMMELPAVVVLAQRPGPATGMPTRTAQQDLLSTLYAGHGEFVKAIYAPGSIEQCYEITRHAIAQAHAYQTPVIILTDQYLQDLAKNVPALDLSLPAIDRQLLADPPADYRRYLLTESGISPRAIPGGPGRVVMDSDEHDESGKLTEDIAMHLLQQDKRMRKGLLMASTALAPAYYGPADAEHLLVAWGSSYGACREAVEVMNRDGHCAALLHFSQVWPLNVPAVRETLSRFRRITVVEGNCTGQFAALLRLAGIMVQHDAVLHYNGLALTADIILDQLAEVCA